MGLIIAAVMNRIICIGMSGKRIEINFGNINAADIIHTVVP